jgi:hypothetical protein
MTLWLSKVLKMKGPMFYIRSTKLRKRKRETQLRMSSLKSRDRKLMTLLALPMSPSRVTKISSHLNGTSMKLEILNKL